jgi:hypothetical protein
MPGDCCSAFFPAHIFRSFYACISRGEKKPHAKTPGRKEKTESKGPDSRSEAGEA